MTRDTFKAKGQADAPPLVRFRHGDPRTGKPLPHTTPPAAIPVDALRELVEGWRKEAARHAKHATNTEWAQWVRDEHHNRASELNGCADELSALIAATKEAGNGN